MSTSGAHSGKIFYSQNFIAIKNRDEIIIRPKTGLNEKTYYVNEYDTCLEQPIKLTIEKLQASNFKNLPKEPVTAVLDFDKLSFPCTIQRWTEGDFFYPFGMNRKKKLSDFFIDEKLSLTDKRRVWLLKSGNDVVWIIGFRIDNRFRITPKTKTVLLLSCND
jgi:tRNA(Ile)-lysidine synthase